MTRDRGDEAQGQQARIAGREAQTKGLRRSAIVTSAVALVGASAVVAVLMLTTHSSAPAYSATDMGGMAGMSHDSGQMPANSPSPTMAGDMPGMDHGSGGMAASAPSPTMADDMPGMDHGSGGMAASSPSPTMADDMPGMDHGDGHGGSPTPSTSADSPWKTHDDSGTGAHEHGSGDSPAKTDDHGSGNMPGMDHGTAAGTAPDRPLAPVLGTFGGASSAVMLSAVFLRRKDRARSEAKQAVRAARRTQK